MEINHHSIIVFCKTLVKGGAEKQALTLARLLSQRGLDVVIISWSKKKVDTLNLDFIKSNSLKYFGLSGGPLHKFIQFNRILKEENASVILAYLTLANFVSGVSRWFNKGIITLGGIRTEKFPVFKLFVEKLVHNHLNDATIFNNYSAKKKFELRGFDPDKIIVIHNAIRVKSAEIKKKNGNEINIITVARFVKAKDFKTALVAFKNLKENNPSCKIRYYIVGYGPMENRIKSDITRLDLTEEVELIINPPNVKHFLQRADIYLSTSLFEGLSNSLMEAMAAGLPLVATDVGDNRFLVRDGYNGYLVTPGDIPLITMRLESMLKSEDLRIKLGDNSFNLIKNDFSEEKLLTSYLKFINKFSKTLQLE